MSHKWTVLLDPHDLVRKKRKKRKEKKKERKKERKKRKTTIMLFSGDGDFTFPERGSDRDRLARRKTDRSSATSHHQRTRSLRR